MRNLLRYRRSPDLLVFATIQPVIFVLLFTYVFGGAVQTVTDNYIDFLLRHSCANSLVRIDQHGFRTRPGSEQRTGRPLPLASDGALSGDRRPHLADTLRNMFVVMLMIVLDTRWISIFTLASDTPSAS